MTFAEAAARLRALDVSCLCDAAKRIRVLDPAIRPIAPGLKMVGRAYPVSSFDDFLPVRTALQAAAADDVLIVDGQGGRHALAGELFATEARRKGLAGLIVDGAVRDVFTLRSLSWPVYTRSITPMAGTAVGSSSVARISCGGVTVQRGEIVVGDDDGVVILAEDELDALIPAAETIQRNESEALRRMAAGESLFDLTLLF